ncbi:unnamed protein product [Lactuca saligna]|uniref:Uncharacterized protein n=1 Tax=Lactuca saligna TaxID=75948 RepID=A0AA36EKY1_LACSI|nr:unnamed protein product [Lactuca saligna]
MKAPTNGGAGGGNIDVSSDEPSTLGEGSNYDIGSSNENIVDPFALLEMQYQIECVDAKFTLLTLRIAEIKEPMLLALKAGPSDVRGGEVAMTKWKPNSEFQLRDESTEGEEEEEEEFMQIIEVIPGDPIKDKSKGISFGLIIPIKSSRKFEDWPQDEINQAIEEIIRIHALKGPPNPLYIVSPYNLEGIIHEHHMVLFISYDLLTSDWNNSICRYLLIGDIMLSSLHCIRLTNRQLLFKLKESSCTPSMPLNSLPQKEVWSKQKIHKLVHVE